MSSLLAFTAVAGATLCDDMCHAPPNLQRWGLVPILLKFYITGTCEEGVFVVCRVRMMAVNVLCTSKVTGRASALKYLLRSLADLASRTP